MPSNDFVSPSNCMALPRTCKQQNKGLDNLTYVRSCVYVHMHAYTYIYIYMSMFFIMHNSGPRKKKTGTCCAHESWNHLWALCTAYRYLTAIKLELSFLISKINAHTHKVCVKNIYLLILGSHFELHQNFRFLAKLFERNFHEFLNYKSNLHIY